MPLTVFITSVSGSREIKANQAKICDILSAKNISFRTVDISVDEENKKSMRGKAGPTAMPPQIYNGDTYIGDFNGFENAVECGTLEEFLNGKADQLK